jgi:hypothetical protein
MPGYGPNTRTMMQIKVNATNTSGTGGPLNAVALAAALPVAYGASQPAPEVPAVAYNAAFGTNNTDIFAHVATGSAAQPTLNFSTAAGGAVTLTGLTLISSGGAGTGSGTGYDPLNPPTIVFNNTVNGVSCLGAGGVSASATAVVSATTRQVTGITNFIAGSGYTCAPTVTFVTSSPIGSTIAVTNGGSGYTAPLVSFNTNGGPGSGAAASATIASTISVAVTPGSGYTAPTVTVSGGGVTGVTGSATVDPATGFIIGVTLSQTTGFTSAPSILISDPTGTGATATAAIVPGTGVVTKITVTSTGTGYTATPTVVITDATGTLAAATAAMATTATGTGAQASVGSTNSQAIPVLTKAEQELFDDYGRYNSTGGVELPKTTAVVQTTVPLNYIDAPTDIIGDGETQIWKLVDNGFWSNSVHFDMVEVQLVNRVGWDGTVKPPASNEVGWKDTIRLNPLEDAIVAMRAKRPSVPFGMPGSLRLKDPSKPLGAAGSGLGFTVDPLVVSPAGVRLLTTATNVRTNYDNEFAWNSAILGHSEDDFTRPVVFHPTVVKPAAPTIVGGTAGNLTWVDPTPAGQLASLPGVVPVLAATLANPQNEIGFKILRATYRANGTLILPYLQIGAMPANATSYTDATQVAGTDYSYEVVAWNNAGSAASTPYTEITAPAVPTWPAAGSVVVNNNGTATLKWNTVAGATQYIVTANGIAQAPIAAGGGATQTAIVPLAVGSVYSITVTAQQVNFGQTATSAASAAVSADMTLPNTPAAPTASAVTATGMTVNWTTVTRTSGAAVSGYTLQYSTDGGTTWANVGTGAGGVRTTAASLGAASTSAAVIGMAANTSYTFQLRANGPAGNGAYSLASAAQLTLPNTPTGVSAANGAIGGAITGGLNWNTVAGLTYTVSWISPTGSLTPSGSSVAISGQQLPFATAGTYSMTVTATNAAGNGASSTAVNVIVR